VSILVLHILFSFCGHLAFLLEAVDLGRSIYDPPVPELVKSSSIQAMFSLALGVSSVNMICDQHWLLGFEEVWSRAPRLFRYVSASATPIGMIFGRSASYGHS